MRSSCCCRSCLAFLLKLLNFLQTFLGLSIVIYSVWMLNVWNRHGSVDGETVNPDLHDLPAPWFVYSFMGVGVLLCLIAFTGHVAAELINGCCLCFHALLTIILIFLEAALVGYLVFNKHWKEDLPSEPTGELERLQSFIESNIDVCKWVGITVVAIQVLSLLLAIMLRAVVSTKRVDYDSDEEIAIVRKPLLYPQYGSTSAESKVIHSGTWSARMREKYGLN